MSVETWSHLQRLGDAEAGEIGALASASLGAKRIATAVRNATGNLEVIAWDLGYDGTVTRLGSAEGGSTTKVEIAALADTDKLELDPDGILKPHGHRFVTAARTEAGGLKVTVWDVDKDGNITRRGSGETGEIQGEFAVATFSTYRVVTAVHDSSGRLKLVSWHVSPNGSVQRLKDALAEEVGHIALATYDPYPPSNGALATVVTTAGKSAGKLEVIAWGIDASGGFQRLGSIEGGPVKDVVAATLSHRRIVTAARNAANGLDVQTWDFDAQGHVSLHASGHAGEIGRLGLTTLNAARVITAVSDSAGNLKLIVWDAIDDVVRLGDAQAGTVGLISVVPLGSDWIATPVSTAAKTLKVIAWREHGVSLLRGEWGPASPRLSKAFLAALKTRLEKVPSDAREERLTIHRQPVDTTAAEGNGATDKGGTSSPKCSLCFEPGIDDYRYDPMIAVGFKYVIITQDHEIGFFDKTGKPLQDAKGAAIAMSTTEFFATFLAGQNADGSRNEHCIHRHTGFSPGAASAAYPPGVNGDPDAPMVGGEADGPRIHEFFDTRVRFDPTSRRFFILASARPQKTINDVKVSTILNPLARRYWAFAVSKTEDPRDGFHQWMTTEAHWFDYTFLAVNQGVMVMATNVGLALLTIPPFGMKPAAFVLSVDDLRHGNPYPRSHKLFPPDFPLPAGSKAYADVVPLTHHGDTAGRTFFINAGGTTINVYSFRNPSSDWRDFPSVDHASATVVSASGAAVPVSNPTEGATFRNGKVYLTWQKTIVDHKPDVQNGVYAIRLLRLPLESLATKPVISTSAADGYRYLLFPNESSGEDAPGSVVSYDNPSITVNAHDHMVILYCRVGYGNPQIFPEARYTVYYAGESKPRHSELIRAGTAMPFERDEDGKTLSTVLTPNQRLDYQTVVCDPSDDAVWMVSEFANTQTNYRTVVGKVTP